MRDMGLKKHGRVRQYLESIFVVVGNYNSAGSVHVVTAGPQACELQESKFRSYNQGSETERQ